MLNLSFSVPLSLLLSFSFTCPSLSICLSVHLFLVLCCPLYPLSLPIFLFFLFLLHQLLSSFAIQMPASHLAHPGNICLLVFLSFFLSFYRSFSTPSIMFICRLFSSPCLFLAVPLLSYLLAYLCVCVCTDNSLAGSVHRYSRPLRAPLFILFSLFIHYCSGGRTVACNCMCE